MPLSIALYYDDVSWGDEVVHFETARKRRNRWNTRYIGFGEFSIGKKLGIELAVGIGWCSGLALGLTEGKGCWTGWRKIGDCINRSPQLRSHLHASSS